MKGGPRADARTHPRTMGMRMGMGVGVGMGMGMRMRIGMGMSLGFRVLLCPWSHQPRLHEFRV